MVVDLPFEGLQVILWRKHQVGNKIIFPGFSRYEKAERGISACTKKVHCSLYKHAKHSHLKSKFFSYLFYYFTLRI